jgi:hypothetical protein
MTAPRVRPLEMSSSTLRFTSKDVPRFGAGGPRQHLCHDLTQVPCRIRFQDHVHVSFCDAASPLCCCCFWLDDRGFFCSTLFLARCSMRFFIMLPRVSAPRSCAHVRSRAVCAPHVLKRDRHRCSTCMLFHITALSQPSSCASPGPSLLQSCSSAVNALPEVRAPGLFVGER